MRKAMPLRWIEESEATEVLSAARFEQAARRSSGGAAGAALADWLNRAHSWLAPQLPAEWPMLQAQPALVRRTEGLRIRREADSGEYRCCW